MPQAAEPTVEAKVAHLSRPGAYACRPSAVERIETHFAWVFLSERYAYKLKKPIVFRSLDLTSLAARRANCELEVVLNRRLAAKTYLGSVPLTLDGSELRLEGDGAPVDWLVKMHRLHREQTLERAGLGQTLAAGALEALVAKLAGFYARAPRVPWDAREYRERLMRDIEGCRRELGESRFGLDKPAIEAIAARQRAIVGRCAEALAARIDAGRVVDAHGDLRPEHIFLGEDPQIIDCLEFSADLRQLDTAEEIAFLCLECDRLGLPDVAASIRALYVSVCSDPGAAELESLYRSRRALLRGLVYAWRLLDSDDTHEPERWRERAGWYVRAASAALKRGGA